jgi:hypothetical protein
MLVAIIGLASVGCSGNVITTNEASKPSEEPAAATSSAQSTNAKLLNAFDFYTSADNRSGYYFSTPSGSWRCVIVPRTWAGCQSASGAGRIGVKGTPQTVTDADGSDATPNAIVVRTEGDATFAAFPADRFKSPAGPSKALPYNMILAAAGFRCNVQEKVGVSCFSEQTDNGFTFSNDGVHWRYTDVP